MNQPHADIAWEVWGDRLAGRVPPAPEAAPRRQHSVDVMLVVPSFGRGGSDDLSGWAWYRLVGEGEWTELTCFDQVRLVADDRSP